MVVAVEPQRHLARLIERSLSEARARFAVHAAALGNREKRLTLHVPRTGSGAGQPISRVRAWRQGDDRRPRPQG